jgi:hypothetical protein
LLFLDECERQSDLETDNVTFAAETSSFSFRETLRLHREAFLIGSPLPIVISHNVVGSPQVSCPLYLTNDDLVIVLKLTTGTAMSATRLFYAGSPVTRLHSGGSRGLVEDII